jgi:hypothetical protein
MLTSWGVCVCVLACRGPYVNFMNLFVTFMYIPLSIVWVVPAAKMGKIPKADLDMPKRPFVVMGLLDSVAGGSSRHGPYLTALCAFMSSSLRSRSPGAWGDDNILSP